MSNDGKWEFSSSGRNMFVSYSVGYRSRPGFLAKIHYGNEINNKYKNSSFYDEEEDPEVRAERERRRFERIKRRKYEEENSFINEEFFNSW